MKKSKVIIPAMALLLFSTAASITGTVAWFTATRVVSVGAGEFVVNNIDDGLEAEVSGGVGTSASTDKKSAVVDANTKLTHGSVNIADTDKTAWILNRDASGPSDYRAPKDTLANAEAGYGTPTSHANRYNVTEAKADKWYVKDNEENDVTYHYYVAFSWTIKFTYTFNHTETNVAVYLNPKESTMEFFKPDGSAAATEGLRTGLGFRIAFFGGETAGAKVFGNNPAAANTLKYATGANETSGVALYSDSNYIHNIASTGEYTAVTDADTDAEQEENEGKAERVCTITKPTAPSKSAYVDVKCVAWFEGEDPNVVSTAEMNKVTANLSFYARNDFAS